jgi:hypothetical protein
VQFAFSLLITVILGAIASRDVILGDFDNPGTIVLTGLFGNFDSTGCPSKGDK